MSRAAPLDRGLGANVLVRYLVGDDPDQCEEARAFVEDGLTPDDPGLVHPVALCELVRVLRQVYEVPKAEIVGALRLLLSVRTSGFSPGPPLENPSRSTRPTPRTSPTPSSPSSTGLRGPV